MSNTIKFPHVVVKDFGRDGNAFALMGQVTSAMKAAKVPKADIDAFRNDAMSGDYDHLLRTCGTYVTLEPVGVAEDDDSDWDDDACPECGDAWCEGECLDDDEDDDD